MNNPQVIKMHRLPKALHPQLTKTKPTMNHQTWSTFASNKTPKHLANEDQVSLLLIRAKIPKHIHQIFMIDITRICDIAAKNPTI